MSRRAVSAEGTGRCLRPNTRAEAARRPRRGEYLRRGPQFPFALGWPAWAACACDVWPTFLSSRGREDRGLRSRHRLHADRRSRWAAAAVGHSDRTRRCLLVLFGLKKRWVAIALFGFCLLTGAFFHTGAEQAIPTSQEHRRGRWLSRSGAARPGGAWSLDGWRGRAV